MNTGLSVPGRTARLLAGRLRPLIGAGSRGQRNGRASLLFCRCDGGDVVPTAVGFGGLVLVVAAPGRPGQQVVAIAAGTGQGCDP